MCIMIQVAIRVPFEFPALSGSSSGKLRYPHFEDVPTS